MIDTAFAPTRWRRKAPHSFVDLHKFKKDRVYSAKKELENIQRHVSSNALVAFGVPGTAANVETVALCLSERL